MAADHGHEGAELNVERLFDLAAKLPNTDDRS